jgi:hypothetical protein
MLLLDQVSPQTQAKDGSGPGLPKASREHIDVLGKFAKIFEVTMSSQQNHQNCTQKSWLLTWQGDGQSWDQNFN